MRHAVEEDFGFAVEDGHRSIKGRGVFREALSGIEGEKRERAGVVAENFARNDATVGVFYRSGGDKDLSFFNVCLNILRVESK